MRLSLGEYLAIQARRYPSRSRPVDVEALPESVLQAEIAAWLRSLGADCAWVQNRMDRATTCRVGQPDFVGSYRGKPFALECKRKGGKPTLVQQGELLRWKLAGASVGVVYTLDEAKRIVYDTAANG